MELMPLMVAVADWAVFSAPLLAVEMVTLRTSTLPVLSTSLPDTSVTVPCSTSKVPSRVIWALWPTAKWAASAEGKVSCRTIWLASCTTATSWPLVTSSPTLTLRV